MKFETHAIHAGQEPDVLTGAVMTPIYQTATFKQDGVGSHRGYEYSRTGNPTRTALEKCIAVLENGDYGLAFASGMATTDAVIRLLGPGDHILVGCDVYGGTFRLFQREFSRYGLEFTYLDTTDPARVKGALRSNTRMVWLETPSNPLLGISDIQTISAVIHAHSSSILLVVDNTFATPYFQQPLELGADVVVHSTTKYLGGHSDVVGGALVTRNEPVFTQLAFLQNAIGAVPGPMDCFLILRGIKTLPIRMDRHTENAIAIAEFLSDHPKVAKLIYPYHPSHPQNELARRQMRGGGGMVSFTLQGGSDTARRVVEATKIFILAESLGGVESLIEVPAAMTHASTSDTPLAIDNGLVRLSVGLEHKEDLIGDLSQALERG